MDRIERYKPEDLKNIPSKKIFTNFGEGEIDLVELHVYGGETLLASEYDVDTFKIDKYIKKGRKRKKPRIELDIHNDIRDLGFKSGLYKVHYNFFRDILGSYNENNGLHISEISDSRTEIRIKTTTRNEEFLSEFEELQEKNIDDFVDEGWQDLLINLGDNNVHIVTNWKGDGDDGILLKLYKPLPKDILVKQQLWIVKEIITSHTEMIKLIPAEKPKDGEEIAGPNFTIDVTKGAGGETGFETWNSLLGTNSLSRQKILNKYISGSGYDTTHLNIDYHYYYNFVHFSSAKERLENFKFKLGLIEYYDNQIATINAMASSSYFNTKNKNSYILKKEEVLNGFDGYEKYLYFESGSYEPDNKGNGIRYQRTWPKTNADEPYTLAAVDSAEATTWFASQSNVALDYDVMNQHNLENVIPFHIREAGDGQDNANYLLFVNMVAHHFDTVYNYLDYTMQIHKRNNPLYEGLSKDLVYNVLASFGWESYQGFHFTDLWEYALGVNEDNTYANSDTQFQITGYATQSYDAFGNVIQVDSGSIKYTLASNQQTGSLITREELSRETWKRMLNNLPYLMKTKGGERGIRALTTTYGLPPTLLRIFEYGGPQKEKTTDSHAIYDKFSFSLQFGEENPNPDPTLIQTPWAKINAAKWPKHVTTNRPVDAFELRFNTTASKNMTLLPRANQFALELRAHPSASNVTSGYYNFGQVFFHYRIGAAGADLFCSSSYMPIYDNDWWNVMVSKTTGSEFGTNNAIGFQLAVCKAADHSRGRITHTSSAFLNVSAQTDAQYSWNIQNVRVTLGGDDTSLASNPESYYTGSLQEYRTWILPEDDDVAFESWNSLKQFHNHARAPLSIEAYGATGSYFQLVQRYSLGADLNRFSSSWNSGNNFLSSSHPNHKLTDIWTTTGTNAFGSNLVATASGFRGNVNQDWITEEERHYTPMPDLVGTREISDKIRIESAELQGRLSDKRKVERSQFDKAPLDSNRLGVYFAPHFEIDLDIAHELGGARFDNYVGNPLDYRDNEYKRLRVLRNHYWKKHDNPYDFFEFLRILRYIDHTLFKQIEMLVPARANAQVGLLVKANLLERPKVENLQEYIEENHYSGSLDISRYRVTANTTTLGGPFHQWQNPKNGIWETGSDEAGTKAIQAHTGYQTLESGSSYGAVPTDQSTAEIEVFLDTRNRHGHKVDIQGSRYYWDNMQWYQSQSVAGANVGYFNNPTASVIQGGASYENAGDFLLNIEAIPAEGYFGIEKYVHSHTSESSFTADNWKVSGSNFNHPNYGHNQRLERVPKFNDRGNIKYYHHQRHSRFKLTPKYHYFAPMNNMANSGSTGNHHSNVSMSGYPPATLRKGFFRSGLRPVSRSYERAEAQDYRTDAYNRLLFAGCKLVGSDFNMPVTTTVDGGPVVEITDTNPNSLVIGSPSAAQGDIEAVNFNDSIR